MIKLECLLCNRYGEYQEDKFYALTGTTNKPDARMILARQRGCERALKQEDGQVHDLCQI